MFLPFSVEMDIGLIVGCRLNIKELQRQDFIDPRATLIKQRQKKPIPYGIAVAFRTFQYQADVVCGKPCEIYNPIIIDIVYFADCFILVQGDCVLLVKIPAEPAYV